MWFGDISKPSWVREPTMKPDCLLATQNWIYEYQVPAWLYVTSCHPISTRV